MLVLVFVVLIVFEVLVLVLVLVLLIGGEVSGRFVLVLEVDLDRPVVGRAALGLGEQRGERAGQRVDLMGGEHGAVDEAGLLL